MAKEVTVRFKIDVGLWQMFKGACLIKGRDRYDVLRELIKEWTGKRLKRAPAKRSDRVVP